MIRHAKREGDGKPRIARKPDQAKTSALFRVYIYSLDSIYIPAYMKPIAGIKEGEG